ncbi:YqhG family protein [Pseudalkalibacillus caeni]|uniref:YqhG n=1 Tax=Exobacillus caeni TaxID=2574798 RepID=A0A5R9F404_9BACL|nr:YqhG family protein [Pseudalkalibacillus caeni]TLS36348.1 hypothetical protein FCL54_15570 [Pseudalkalibacillus caeni]
MQQEDIHNYLKSYFIANNCEITRENNGLLGVQLTIEMDKEIMNRPFYWHYLEKTGGVPQPMELSFFTSQDYKKEKGEFIHFGSPRLHQIFNSTKKLASYIRMFEEASGKPGYNMPLHPWLCLNIKVSYQCDRKKDRLLSLGIHLISGAVLDNFHSLLEKKELTPKIPDFCFTMTPIIKPLSGIKRLEAVLASVIQADNHSWAEDAHKRWAADLDLLNLFYTGNEDAESYQVEKEALRKQYEPVIKADIINGGMFYLTPQTSVG